MRRNLFVHAGLALLLGALTLPSRAGIVAISNTQGRTVVLTSEDCATAPGWGVARLANGNTVEAYGCWQLADSGVVVARFLPEWKDIRYGMETFRWVPNIQHTRNK